MSKTGAPNWTAEHWWQSAIACGEMIANHACSRGYDPDRLDDLLERAGQRICDYMLEHGLEHSPIEASIQAMADACVDRVNAAIGPGGHA
jgi:hypothetical protein